MEKSQLAGLVETLNKKEIRDLRKWLRSPSHNQQDPVIALFEYLTTDPKPSWEKEAAFECAFPGQVFDDARLRQAMHFLLRAVEDYLAWQEWSSESINRQIVLAGIYRKRKLSSSFQKVTSDARKTLDQQPYRNEWFYRQEYLLQSEQYKFLEGKKQLVPMNLQEISDALDYSFITDKLRQACLMLAHQTVYKAEYSQGLLENILNYIRERELYRTPAIGIYYYVYYSLIDKTNESHFESLKSLLSEHGALFPKEELWDIYVMAINYGVGRLNAGVTRFYRETFELYREGLANGALLKEGQLSRWTYLNIVAIGVVLKEFEWVESFIADFQDYIDAEDRRSFVDYCLARLYYEQGHYERAMDHLIHVEYEGFLMTLNARIILAKIYYVREEEEPLLSLLESTRAYMQRKKVLGYHKSNYSNVLRSFKKLVRVNPYSKTQIEKLRKEVESTNPLTERPWLLEQLGKLSG